MTTTSCLACFRGCAQPRAESWGLGQPDESLLAGSKVSCSSGWREDSSTSS